MNEGKSVYNAIDDEIAELRKSIARAGDIAAERGRPIMDDLEEQNHALHIVIASKCQTIDSLTARVEALEQENGKLRAQLIDLENQLRDYQE